ncbi:hypothetical protein G7Z17_g10689 [Cylindrodendrum hubeiense]|uniref:Phospholipase/carboxylesterase/thioesterase domain-containing protein n=1 Tax=Cylindrodendrum hubeiense TaxID=595255 RepID=A0A9P5H4F3_9HYPO|nr:hypothetical protein G7Z17_g10689 [Cylindrodendrum hubeiense]
MAELTTHAIDPIYKPDYSFIILHDHASNGGELLTTVGSLTNNILVQHTRWVFPNASYPIISSDGRQGGLNRLVMAEAHEVGWENVFVGGIGMGAAIGMAMMLRLWTTRPLGGFFGLDAWMPFVDDLSSLATWGTARLDVNAPVRNIDLMSHYTTQPNALIPPQITRISDWLRRLTNDPCYQDASQTSVNTPVLLVHAISDGDNKWAQVMEAMQFLQSLGFQGDLKTLPNGDYAAGHISAKEFLGDFLDEPSWAHELYEGIMDMINAIARDTGRS